MEIRQLRTLMSIVKLGSFSEAARQLGYTQSSVTSHIQLLEKELGTALFERMGHSLMLTADGERLYTYAERMVRMDDEAHAVLGKHQEPVGSLSIGMSETIAEYHLDKVLLEYAQLYPKVTLRLQLGSSRSFQSLLRKNMIDLAFYLEEKVRDEDLTAHELWTEPIVLVSAPSHVLAGRQNLREQDFAQQTLILTDSNSSYPSVLEDMLGKKGVELTRILEMERLKFVRHFACEGMGVAVLPLAAVCRDIKAGQLCTLSWGGREWNMHAYMVHHKEKWLSLPMKLFMKLVHERMPKV